MIEFSSPPLSLSLTEYMELAELWDGCCPCAGFCVSLGEKFFTSGVQEVDKEILPKLSAKAAAGVVPRVLPSYSILFWFSHQVCYEISSLRRLSLLCASSVKVDYCVTMN